MLVTERVAIGSVRPHPKNPRRGNVDAIATSLKAHGQFRPLLVQRSTGFIIGGNHTWQAMRRLKWREADVVFLDVDDDEAARILLADNRTSDLSGYDDSGLMALLKDLAESPAGIEATGFNDEDLAALVRIDKATSQGVTDASAEWVGMPSYAQPTKDGAAQVVIRFPTEDDANDFFAMIERPRVKSLWWPHGDNHRGMDTGLVEVADDPAE